MSDHAERKIDAFFWCLIAFAVIYLIGHLVVAFTRDAFDTPSVPVPVSAATRFHASALPASTSTSTSTSSTVPAPLVWDRLADCESGEWDRFGHPIPGTARWDDQRGGYEGGVHFDPPTWVAFAPSGFPAHAWQASRVQQIEVAERVLVGQGWGAWPVCSRKIGVR